MPKFVTVVLPTSFTGGGNNNTTHDFDKNWDLEKISSFGDANPANLT